MRRQGLWIFLCCLLLAGLSPGVLYGDDGVTEEPEGPWAVGVSAISPGLPVALKAVLYRGDWAVQFEANYFYLWGMARIDGRRTVRRLKRADLYGFAGLTGVYFAEDSALPKPEEYTLMADFGVGAELRLGRRQRIAIGAEGGLLVPFLSSISLDYYDNTGVMVANVYLLCRFP